MLWAIIKLYVDAGSSLTLKELIDQKIIVLHFITLMVYLTATIVYFVYFAMWDKMDEWNQEMEDMRSSIPDLQAQLDSLTEELQREKRKTFAINLYKAVDTDVTDQLSFKFFVQKLSGFAKYELDTKITKVQFFHLVEHLSQVEVPEEGEIQEPPAEGEEAVPKTKNVFDLETYEKIKQAFETALNPTAATPLYSSDQNNATYLKILNDMKTFDAEKFAEPPIEEPAE